MAGRRWFPQVEIFLHQDGRDAENVANVVESIAGIVDWQIFPRESRRQVNREWYFDIRFDSCVWQ